MLSSPICLSGGPYGTGGATIALIFINSRRLMFVKLDFTFPSSRHGCLSSGISPVLSLGMVVVRSETFVGCTGRRSVLRQGGFPLLSECLEGR